MWWWGEGNLEGGNGGNGGGRLGGWEAEKVGGIWLCGEQGIRTGAICLSSSIIYDDVIMRTIVDLPEGQVLALGEYCKREGISRAEAVRRAVEVLLASRLPMEREAAFGAWGDRGDSRVFVDRLRGEWNFTGGGDEGDPGQ
jgi:hypothetical protein